MRKIIAILLMLITLCSCGNMPTKQEEIVVTECTHSNIFKKDFYKIINGEQILAGTTCQCIDCGYEYTEYSEAYIEEQNRIEAEKLAAIQLKKDNEEFHIHQLSTGLEDHRTPCQKCGKMDETNNADPRYCPYCKFDRILGKTLTESKAKKLVGQDLDAIKANIKTVGDMVTYLLAADTEYIPNSRAAKYKQDNFEWQLPEYGSELIKKNRVDGHCPSVMSLTTYLLSDDYDDTTNIYLYWTKNSTDHEAHYTTFFKIADMYYTGDIQMMNSPAHASVVASGKTVKDICKNGYNFPFACKKGIEAKLIVEMKPTGDPLTCIPMCTRDATTTSVTVYFPTDAKDQINVIHLANENCKVEFKDCTVDIPNWNSIM